MIRKILEILILCLFILYGCNAEPKEKVNKTIKEEPKKNVYQETLKKQKVKSKKATAVQYKFGEPSDTRLHIYIAKYNKNGYITDSIAFRNNYRVSTETFEYGKNNKIIKRSLFDSSETLVSTLERKLNNNGDEISFKSFLRDTLRYSQKKSYNEKNQLVKITDYYNDGSVKNVSTYAYNSNGDVINKTEMNDLGIILYKQNIGYDSKNRKISEVDIDSLGNIIGKTLIKDYDNNDKIQLIEKYDENDSLYAKYKFEYDNKGNETKNTIYNGLNQILRQSITKYNEDGNMVSFKIYEGELGLRGSDLITYNKDGLEVESKTLDNQNNLKHKRVKIYNSKKLLEREINYNHLDEPEFEFKYEYTYFE